MKFKHLLIILLLIILLIFLISKRNINRFGSTYETNFPLKNWNNLENKSNTIDLCK